jgi:hypothetical protein
LIVGRFNIDDGVTGRGAVPNKVFEQAGKRREAAAHRRGCSTFLLALYPLPRDDGAMIDLAQRGRAGDAEGVHEVSHVEPVGPAGLWTLVLRQPDFFFGDGGELVEAGELAGAAGRDR